MTGVPSPLAQGGAAGQGPAAARGAEAPLQQGGAAGGGPAADRGADAPLRPQGAGGSEVPALTYDEAVAYISGLGRFGVKLGLARSRMILDELGHPERGKRGALIAGTNGKGSTAAFLESILRAAGLHTGMTPSPHLRSYTERVQLDAVPIAEREFAAAVSALRPRLARVIDRLGPPTEFEVLIGLAVGWLAPRADRLVIEVGMGGRLDSTNVLDLGVAVITNVDLDHQRYLGSTVEEIAAEKAGVIKPGNTVVTGAEGSALGVIERAAERAGAATLWRLGREVRFQARPLGWEGVELDVGGPGFAHERLRVGLLGRFQAANAALAVAAAHALGDATPEAVRRGLESARWPGRLEPAGERLLMDGAHNPAGLRALAGEVRRLIGAAPLAVVFGAMADKELSAMLPELRRLEPDHVVFTAAASAGHRAAPPDELARAWGQPSESVADATRALERARRLAGPEGWVLVCGSLYLVGEVRG
jgi:dihydrofolate synthase/folylpolyglutamate synthase